MKTSLRRLLGRSATPRMPDKQVLIRDVLNGRSDSVASAVLGAVFLGEDGRRYKLTEVESPDRLTFRRTDR